MIFVDTGAWFAVAVDFDVDHQQAIDFVSQNRQPLITTDYVIDELLTLFAARGIPDRGVQWVRQVRELRTTVVEFVTPADFDEALRVYERFQDKRWSFTDCTSYVVMKRLNIDAAFSFDSHFRQFGTVAVLPA